MILLLGVATLLVGFIVGFLCARNLYEIKPPENPKKKFKFTYKTYKWTFDTIIYAHSEEEAIKKFKKEEYPFVDNIIRIEEL